MRAVVQRVTRASVEVEGEPISAIGPGMLVLLGVGRDDDEETADRMADKLARLRIFDDSDGRMNDPLADREALVVSQFTLYADSRRGNRPSFADAAAAEIAEALYERVRERLGAEGGRFGARMTLELEADGPVTILLEI